MKKIPLKILISSILFFAFTANAQLFRNKNRMDNLEGFDEQPYNWGFYLVANNFDYKIVLNPTYGIYNNVNMVSSKPTYGFGAGLIGKARISENFDVRIEPALQFVERKLTFNTQTNDRFAAGNNTNAAFTPTTLTDTDMSRNVKSTYIDIPLLLEFHGDRWYNSRPYFAAGFNYMVNLQSNSTSTDDNQQGIFRTTTHNFAWSAELGIQFYFQRFKLTPGVRGTFMLNNELVADNDTTPPYWAAAISTMQSRAFMLVLKFE